MTTAYALYDLCVGISWDDDTARTATHRTLTYFGLQPSAASEGDGATPRPSVRMQQPSVRMHISTQERPPRPEGAEQAATYNEVITAWRTDGGVFLEAGEAAAMLQPERHVARLYVRPLLGGSSLDGSFLNGSAAAQRRLIGLLVLSLFALLRRRGVYPLHAAALAREGQGLLIVAPSDAGKSTLAYSLVRAGWDYLSDDSVLLCPTSGGVDVHPFRRLFGLDPEAEAAFPELGKVWQPQLADEAKWAVDVEALRPGQFARRCRPRAILLPEIVGQPESEVRAASLSEAMLGVTRQSPLVALEPEWAPRHLRVLRQLVRQAQAYRLRAGRDLKADPEHAHALLHPLLERASVSRA